MLLSSAMLSAKAFGRLQALTCALHARMNVCSTDHSAVLQELQQGTGSYAAGMPPAPVGQLCKMGLLRGGRGQLQRKDS